MMNRQRKVIALVISEAGRRMIIDEEDSSSDEEILEKIDNYAEKTIPRMTDHQFQRHFRMHPNTFEIVLGKLSTVHHESAFRGVPHRVDLEKEFMITIWCLGNMESFRSVADRFGIANSTCWDVLYRTCKLLLEVNNRYSIIKWPSQLKQEQIRQKFGERANGFPGCIGCIDGCHIKINAPKENPSSYINRKNYHSVLLQGVCDIDKRFIDVYVGEAGSIHDYTLYKRSDLYLAILNNDVIFYDDHHIVGDLAYKLGKTLLVGFKNNGRLTARQKNFNKILSKARVVIENTFALLKGRFRRLKFLETVRLDLISLLIVCGCILHNLCLESDDFLDHIIDLEEERIQILIQNPRNFRDIGRQREQQEAINKRNMIMNGLPLLRQL